MSQVDERDPTRARREVLVHGSMYTVAAAAPALVTVLVTPVVTRMLGNEQYGVVATAMLVVQIGLIALSFGMAEAIARHGIIEASGIPGARALVLRGAVLSCLATVVLVLTGPLWSRSVTGLAWQPAVALAVAGAFFFGVITNVQAVQRAMGRPGPFVLLGTLATFGGPVLGLLAMTRIDRSPAVYVGGLVAGYGVAASFALVILGRQGPAQHEKGDVGRALRTGFPMIAHQSSLYLATAALVVTATHARGIEAGGRMQLALLVGSAPAIIAMAIGNSWAPVLYRAPVPARGHVMAATARDVVSVIAVLSGGVSLLSPWILRFLAPATFGVAQLVPVAAIAAGGCALAVAYLANVHVVFASGRSAGLAVIAPSAVGVAVIAVATLGPGRPLWALAAGFPIAYAVMAAAAGVLRRRVTSVRFSEAVLLPWIGLGIGCALLGGTLPQAGLGSLSRLAIGAVLAVVGVGRLRPLLSG